MKKLLSILTALALTATGVSGFGVFAATPDRQSAEKSNEIFLSQEDVFEALAYTFGEAALKKEINSKTVLSPSGARVKGFCAEDYSEYTHGEYGGMYLDDNGVLVLLFVENSDAAKNLGEPLVQGSFSSQNSTTLKSSNNEIVAENYTLKAVKYSEKELLNAYEKVNRAAVKTGLIKTAEVDYCENKITVGIENASAAEAVCSELAAIEGMFTLKILHDAY